MKMLQKVLALYLSSWLLFAPAAMNAAQTAQSAGQSAPQVVKQTPEGLDRLVAPIALYPDALVSQILAGGTYPTEIVEVDRWVQAIRTSKERIWRMPSTNSLGTRASRRSPSSPPCSPTWTRTCPGPLRSARPMQV